MDKSKQCLPAKENSLFKRILKSYEQKQYKNGLKFAKQILNNFPDHGETLAMKGLTLNCLGRKDEAYQFVRLGLRNNLQSHVCWHVFGLLQRSDKKYEEAIKCYRNALKWEKDNLQILRDLSLLQIQMRDLDGYKETRYRLFSLRPSQKASWIGYAMSFHLLKDYEMARKVLEEFRKTVQKTTYDYEYSELLLYQNMVMREDCDYEGALKHLDTFKTNICDKVTLQEVRGEILMNLGRKEDASVVYRGLVARNPENRNYYLLLEESLGLTTSEQKLKHYEELKELFPRAHVPRRLPLDYATGDALEKLLDVYLRAGLLKGVPPLFTDLLSLYSDPEKVQMIETLLLGYQKNLGECGSMTTDECDSKEPTCTLFVFMFLAQHYNHLGDTEKALDLLQSALEHTPTLIELYILKAKILKHAGDYRGAHETLIEAQSLDTADRYVNSRAASYLLTSNLIVEAEEMCSKFTREEVSAMENLNEMQCMWFQTECALAFNRLKQYGNCLKKCHEVDRHFTEIIEDQFDFHTYCMRKMTLRSYIELLRLEDGLRNNRAYWQAARIAIKIYLKLHDEPITDVKETVNTSTLTATQLKKYRQQQKKARKVEEAKEEERKREEEKKQNKHKHKNNQNEDAENSKPEALVPSKLERPADALAEAIYFLKPLQVHASQRIETHLFAFEIFFRKQKPLIMLQSLKRAFAIDATNPELHTCFVRFLQYYRTKMTSANAAVKAVVEKEMTSRIATLDPLAFNEAFLNQHQDSIPHRLQAARSMTFLDKVQRDRALSIATDVSSHLKARTLVNLKCVLEWMESSEFKGTEAEIGHYKAACLSVFPRAMDFRAFEPTSCSNSPTYSTANSASPTTTTAINNSIVTPTSNHIHATQS